LLVVYLLQAFALDHIGVHWDSAALGTP